MARTYYSKTCEIVHGAMARLYVVGLLDTQRMLEFDRLCLTDKAPQTPFPQIGTALHSAIALRALRQREGASVNAFAGYLNVEPQTVIAWEAGTLRPTTAVARLLDIVAREGLGALH
ncbi:MAG: transcriptional regulator [Pseudomonadota bacterium]